MPSFHPITWLHVTRICIARVNSKNVLWPRCERIPCDSLTSKSCLSRSNRQACIISIFTITRYKLLIIYHTLISFALLSLYFRIPILSLTKLVLDNRCNIKEMLFLLHRIVRKINLEWSAIFLDKHSLWFSPRILAVIGKGNSRNVPQEIQWTFVTRRSSRAAKLGGKVEQAKDRAKYKENVKDK